MPSSFRFKIAAASLLALAMSTGAAHARDTSKACHQKFVTARTAGSLNGQSYKEFKAAQCGDTATAETTARPAESPAAAPVPASPTAPAAAAAAPAAASTATMPTAIAEKYSKESAGKGRMHTCLDQYNANKATNANGGLRWIQSGGGYYSVCNSKLKG